MVKEEYFKELGNARTATKLKNIFQNYINKMDSINPDEVSKDNFIFTSNNKVIFTYPKMPDLSARVVKNKIKCKPAAIYYKNKYRPIVELDQAGKEIRKDLSKVLDNNENISKLVDKFDVVLEAIDNSNNGFAAVLLSVYPYVYGNKITTLENNTMLLNKEEISFNKRIKMRVPSEYFMWELLDHLGIDRQADNIAKHYILDREDYIEIKLDINNDKVICANNTIARCINRDFDSISKTKIRKLSKYNKLLKRVESVYNRLLKLYPFIESKEIVNVNVTREGEIAAKVKLNLNTNVKPHITILVKEDELIKNAIDRIKPDLDHVMKKDLEEEQKREMSTVVNRFKNSDLYGSLLVYVVLSMFKDNIDKGITKTTLTQILMRGTTGSNSRLEYDKYKSKFKAITADEIEQIFFELLNLELIKQYNARKMSTAYCYYKVNTYKLKDINEILQLEPKPGSDMYWVDYIDNAEELDNEEQIILINNILNKENVIFYKLDKIRELLNNKDENITAFLETMKKISDDPVIKRNCKYLLK